MRGFVVYGRFYPLDIPVWIYPKKLTDFLGHEIEVSIRIAFQHPKNITLNLLSGINLHSHITGMLPILRQNLNLLIENVSTGVKLIAEETMVNKMKIQLETIPFNYTDSKSR